MSDRKHPYDPSEPDSLSDNQLDWIFVTLGVLCTIATAIQVIFYISAGLSGVFRIFGVFFSTAVSIAVGVVYLLRVSGYAENIVGIVWNTTTAGGSIKEVRGVKDALLGFLREEIPPAPVFKSRTKNQEKIVTYAMFSLVGGVVFQMGTIVLFADQGILETATETFVKGLGADISFTVLTIIRPTFGLIFLLLRSISGSQEGFMILVGVIGAPSVTFVLLAWNVIALVENRGYATLRKFQNRFVKYGYSRRIAGVVFLIITMIVYALATVSLYP